MAVMQVEVVDNVLEVVHSTNTTGAVDVVTSGTSVVQNAIVSPTPPENPYEGQVWIDIS